MAVKRKQTGKAAKSVVFCRDCIHSGHRFERDVNGEFFMVWCPFHEWAQFLRQAHECAEFKAGDPIPGEEDPWPHHKSK